MSTTENTSEIFYLNGVQLWFRILHTSSLLSKCDSFNGVFNFRNNPKPPEKRLSKTTGTRKESFLENRLADERLAFHVSWKKSEPFAMNELDHWRILRIVSLWESLIFYIIWCSTLSQLVQSWDKSKSDKRVWKHLIRWSAGNCFTGKLRKNSSICFRPLCTVMSS